MPWNDVFKRLLKYAESHPCNPPKPPIPLILGGWVYSNDVEKMDRWESTVAWAEENGCADLTNGVPSEDFYYADEPTDYMVGPFGGPMYLMWNGKARTKPSKERGEQIWEILTSRWADIVGRELASVTRPLELTGPKARRLVVRADATAEAPWGSWSHIDRSESARTAFRELRAAINKAIEPHEIDHIDFVTDASV